jgi:two-component system sensor histidine kinase TorS
MGGGLTVESEPGIGSRFTLTLLLAEATEAAIGPDDTLPGAGIAAGRNVLVVDDHPVNRLVARSYLERFGASVTEASTGVEALVCAMRARFDLILLDLHLPDIDGAELAAQIERKGAAVAILTAGLVADDAQTRAEFGVDHVLMKPLSPRALASLLGGEGGSPPAVQASSPPAPDADAALVQRLEEDIADLGMETAGVILAGYIEDLPAAVAAIRKAMSPEDRRKAAHRLKGASANFGLEELCGLLQRIETEDADALDALEEAAAGAACALRAAAARAGLQLDPVDPASAKQ